jgi:hypothetical protein
MKSRSQRLPQTTRIAWTIGALLFCFSLHYFLVYFIGLPIHTAGFITVFLSTVIDYPVARGFPNNFMKDKRPFTFISWLTFAFLLSSAFASVIWLVDHARD